MKINEVVKSRTELLTEEVDMVNDTEFLTEDLVRVIETKNGPWSQPMTGDEFEASLRALVGGNG